MTRQLETYFNVEIRWTVGFFVGKTLNEYRVHRDISTVYGLHAISTPAIVKWCQMLEDSSTNLTDVVRDGRSVSENTPDMVQRVEDIIHSNCKVRKAQIACSKKSNSI